MPKVYLSLVFILSGINFILAQPAIQWQKCLGGSGSDVAYSIQQTPDSGFIIAGYTESNDSDITIYHGNRDYWIVKLNSTSGIEWQKSLGGTSMDMPSNILPTSDGGFIIGGYSLSNDIDVSGNHGQEDFWIVKTNATGIIEWQKSFGGSNVERAYSIKQTSTGGYIVGGSANSTDGDITFHHGGISVQHDFWIVNLDSLGNIIWQKCLGGSNADVAKDLQETADGGFIVAGQTNSLDGDVTGHHGTTTYADCWIVKLNINGDIQWQKSLGGSLDEFSNSIHQTSDGGFIIAGDSKSSDGDVSFHWGSFVENDFWIVKTDSSGAIIWEKTFGGTGIDMVNSISQTSDGGYVVTGYTSSNDGDLTGLHGLSFDYDYWIIKLNDSGVIQWQKVIGGTGNDVARCIQQTNDDGYIVAGSSSSMNGDVSGNNGSGDFWIVKLSPVVGVPELGNSVREINISPNPFSGSTSISFENLIGKIASVKIYSPEGRLVKNIFSEESRDGYHQILWNATDNFGNQVNPGVYIVIISSDIFSESRKVVVLGK